MCWRYAISLTLFEKKIYSTMLLIEIYIQSQSRLDEIIQEKPANKERTQWRKFLKSLCHEDSQRLVRGLGQWITTIQTSQRSWPFITQGILAYYTVGVKTGMMIRSINSMNTNAMLKIFSIFNRVQQK